MNLIFSNKAWGEYMYWKNKDNQILKKINQLIKDIKRKLFDDVSKTKLLKYKLNSFCSRRISNNRLVYKVSESYIAIVSCRFYYKWFI